VDQPRAPGPGALVLAGPGPGGDRGQGHRGGQQGHRLDPGRDRQGDARDQRGVPVDEQVHGRQQQGHGHPDLVAVDPGGHEQHRADRDQDGRAGGQLEGPPGLEHLEHQQGRPQVAQAGRDPGQQVQGRAAAGGGGQGDGEELDGQCGQGGHPDKPLERIEMGFRLETLERSHGSVA
jgi:hypothetical protein